MGSLHEADTLQKRYQIFRNHLATPLVSFNVYIFLN